MMKFAGLKQSVSVNGCRRRVSMDLRDVIYVSITECKLDCVALV